MELKTVSFRKGHVILNVPCNENNELSEETKSILRKYYFSTLLNKKNILTVDFNDIKQIEKR